MAKTYKIAVIPGDGIGKEVTPWAQKALEKAAEGVADFEYENFDLGAERYLRDGAILPEDEEVAVAGATGRPLPVRSDASVCFENIARRYLGEEVRLARLEKM